MRFERTVIGMVHLPPLPGSPRWEGSMVRVVASALTDARALIDGGADALLVENFGDAPFTPGRVEPATVAASWGVPVWPSVTRTESGCPTTPVVCPSSSSVRPAKRESPSRTNSHFASSVPPGTRLGVSV